MKYAAALLSFMLPGIALAQASGVPDSVLKQLAKDLADLQASVVDAQHRQQQASVSPIFHLPGVRVVTVTNSSAFAKAGANESSDSLFKLSRGQKYTILDKNDTWYAVAFPEPVKGLESGWIKAADVVPTYEKVQFGQQQTRTPSIETGAEEIYQVLTEKVGRLRRAYQENPYVTVTGFAVNVGVPLSVTVSFEFKK